MKFKYPMSVIMPIYNSEEFLEEAIKSIINQSIGIGNIELLLINDGSTDKSKEICERYSKNYESIKLFNQENQGVSIARNRGIDEAQGRYIAFLDSDDLLDKNSILSLVEYFNEIENKVDIIGYSLYYYVNGKQKAHSRTINYKQQGIKDVISFPHFNQATMNICIKNREKNERIYFDENLIYAEDSLFNTNNILIKGKIGVCSKAKYLYRRTPNSAVNRLKNPVNSYKELMDYFCKMVDKHTYEGKLHVYAQSILLFEINWRFKQGCLFPYHLNQNEYEQWHKSLINIIKQIDNKIITTHPQVDNFHKSMFIRMKSENYEIIEGPTETAMLVDGKRILKENQVELIIRNVKINNNKLIIDGFVKSRFNEDLDVKLFKRVSDASIEVNLKESSYSYYKCKIKTNKFLAFETETNIEVNSTLVDFFIVSNGIKKSTKYYFLDTTVFAQDSLIKEYLKDNIKVKYIKGKFQITKLSNGEYKKNSKLIDKNIYKSDKKYYILRKLIKANKKEIWLYNDRRGVIDNAYYQFKNDFNKKDGIIRYYINDGGLNDIEKLFTKKEQKHLVRYQSSKHKLLFLNSKKIITSFQSFTEYSPIAYKWLHYVRDLLKYEIIYVQHGVLHANLPLLYSKEHSKVDKFVISSEFEKQNLINNYGYNDSDLISTGMPRLDHLKQDKQTENRILFAPTWRKDLTAGYDKKNRVWNINEESFINSTYYKKIVKFLTSEKLLKVLKDNNLILDFNLHPNFKAMTHVFNMENDNIKLTTESIDINKYKLLITDFSSFLFDFVYLKTPILYFIPDKDEFMCWNHSYNKLDLDLEMGFGRVAYEFNILIENLKSLVDNNLEVEDIYKERVEKFFYPSENRCEGLYKKLISDK